MSISSVATLLLATLGLDGTVYPSQMKVTNNTYFDYIIVGGGTAGCVVAKNMAEDKKYTVLVLEVGDDPSGISLLPALFPLLPSTDLDHDYVSTDNNYAARGQGNNTKLTSGKMLGGSNGLHHLLHLLGVRKDYNDWAEITGDESWSYENVLPFFRKSESVKDAEIMSENAAFHGTDGPIGVTRQTHDDQVADYFSAFAETGNKEVLDLNANASLGYTQPLLTIDGGIRQSTGYCYLKSIKDYSNLYVSKNTLVTRIIFENKTAVAVEAIYKNVTYIFRANKEVIVSAGAFNTPQILMLSGVGPKGHLESLNIEVISDLPVGDNLVAPACVCLAHKTKKSLLPIPNPTSLVSSLNLGKLPFPLIVLSGSSNKSYTVPTYQAYNLVLPHDTPFLTLACTLVYGYLSDICKDWQTQASSHEALYSVLWNTETKSRGTVRLRSTNPSDPPVISTGFYTDSEDLDTMLENVKDFISIGKTSVFQKMGAALIGIDFQECADKEPGSDEFWICYILNRTISPFLYTSTCSMGSVVDSELKVIGMKNFRIVDASVMPKMIHGATNAAVVMIAEKASDMIKSSA